MQKHSFEAIGTRWSIETTDALAADIQRQIHARIDEFDYAYSRFRQESLVARLRQPGEYVFPADAVELVTFYRDLYVATDGAVTPLIGTALEQAGYDAEYSLRPKSNTAAVPKWHDAMQWNGSTVIIKKPITFDVGAAGKGYLVDIVAGILMSHNINAYVIDASGDIRCKGVGIERIGLENPYDTTSVIGTAELTDSSLCGSAINRRAWGEWHHIINPKSGKPIQDIVATWVTADTTMLADGLATALFFVPPIALTKWKFESVRLFANGKIEKTPGFVGELYI
jgi:thiamine biosynthesis lipoprotein